MHDELDIIRRAKDGDTVAFEMIVNNYKNYVFAIILNFIKDNQEAENILQETFLQIYLSLPKYENDNFKGWISRITSNKSIDYIRKKKAKFKEEVLENSEIIIKKSQIDKNTPENILLAKETKEKISKEFSSIPKIYEDTIKKFYLEGKSYEEISFEEKVSIKTVASRIYRGKNMLKEKWSEKDETLWHGRMDTL